MKKPISLAISGLIDHATMHLGACRSPEYTGTPALIFNLITATDAEIDRLVYELYGLTEEKR